MSYTNFMLVTENKEWVGAIYIDIDLANHKQETVVSKLSGTRR